MKSLTAAVLGGLCALGLSATSASAEVVCNRDGDCWHVKTRYDYRPDLGLKVHPDSWRWADRDQQRYRWREHDGRGYWRNGVWVQF